MKRLLLIVSILLFVGCAFGLAIPERQVGDIFTLTYGELAAVTCPGLFEASIAKLNLLTPDVAPGGAAVKPARGAIRVIRNCLDVFAFAYPPTTSYPHFKKDDDAFEVVRGALNAGYELIGAYRNLIYVNATELVTNDTRAAMLDWSATFLKNANRSNYDGYISNPSLAVLHPREKLSPFFWGLGKEPSQSRTGLQNVIHLLGKLFAEAVGTYSKFYDQVKTTPLTTDRQTAVHDYRKQIRAILAIIELFTPANLFTDGTSIDDALTTTEELYTNIGLVEDEIAAYQFYEQNGSKSQLKDAEEALADQTNELHDWLRDEVNVIDVLKYLQLKRRQTS